MATLPKFIAFRASPEERAFLERQAGPKGSMSEVIRTAINFYFQHKAGGSQVEIKSLDSQAQQQAQSGA